MYGQPGGAHRQQSSMLAKRLRLDPALVAAPLITTCVDAAAITIYFSIATSLFKL